MLNLIEYHNLPLGETRKGECPNCGRDKFYVTRKPEGLAYICFRATCSLPPGYEQGSFAPVEPRSAASLHGRKSYYGSMGLISPEDLQFFVEDFGLELDSPAVASSWIKLSDDGRYVLPIWGPRDEYRGVVVRRPTWEGCPRKDTCHDGMPKAVTYLEQDAKARLAWYHSSLEHTVVIVEDQISAMRIASEGYTGVALLGTNMGYEQITDLLRFKNAKRFVLALDPDATMKAIKLAQQYHGVLRSLTVAILDRDPKDYPPTMDGSEQLLRDLRL